MDITFSSLHFWSKFSVGVFLKIIRKLSSVNFALFKFTDIWRWSQVLPAQEFWAFYQSNSLSVVYSNPDLNVHCNRLFKCMQVNTLFHAQFNGGIKMNIPMSVANKLLLIKCSNFLSLSSWVFIVIAVNFKTAKGKKTCEKSWKAPSCSILTQTSIFKKVQCTIFM